MSERPINPTTTDVTRALIEQGLSELHTSFPARIEAYDHTKQTADVKPLIKFPFLQPDGSSDYEDLPIITSVPVCFPRTRGWFVALPMDVGDTVTIVCAELALAAWRESDGEAAAFPGDLRRHYLTGAIAYPGLYPTRYALTHAPPKPTGAAADAPAIVIGSDADDGTRVTLHLDGSVTIKRGTDVAFKIDADRNVHIGGAAGEKIAKANLVNARVDALQQKIDSHTHVVAGPCPAFVMTAGIAAPITSPLGPQASVASERGNVE